MELYLLRPNSLPVEGIRSEVFTAKIYEEWYVLVLLVGYSLDLRP
jgi:hypothetical protein